MFNLQLVQRLARVQQMAALQTLSVFFVHDLKNLASNLAMTLQNLPVHYDNSAFRDDLLRLIADSVAKLDGMRSRLSVLTRAIELHYTETDLNELVCDKLADLQPLPPLQIDSEQIENVLVNLALNAQEAGSSSGEIRVATERLPDCVMLSVHDHSCGISQECMEQALFQPFRTTKRYGLGIELFQSKMIVEAYKGSIDVESEVGKVRTFRLFLQC